MSVREGNRLLVVNNMLRVFTDAVPAELTAVLYQCCQNLELGDLRKAVHFRRRPADDTVRLEVRNADDIRAALHLLLRQLLQRAGAPVDDDALQERLDSDVLPHVMAYVASRGDAEAVDVDMWVQDTAVWLCMNIDPSMSRVAAQHLVARYTAPPRSYAAPRSEKEFEALEAVYRAALSRFKRPRDDDAADE